MVYFDFAFPNHFPFVIGSINFGFIDMYNLHIVYVEWNESNEAKKMSNQTYII